MRTWRLERNWVGAGPVKTFIIENETNDLIAKVYNSTPDKLEIIRKAPEFAYACVVALDELELHERMAKQDNDTDLLNALEVLRRVLA